VSGKVTRSDKTTAISGATLYLQKTGTTTKTNASYTKTDGTYIFNNVIPGTYDVIATKAGYTFSSPAYKSVSVSTTNRVGVNFSSITP
jgi:uncharacterized surface anchored protein